MFFWEGVKILTSKYRNINFIRKHYKNNYTVSMTNYSINLKTGKTSVSILESDYVREIYDIPVDNVGFAKYTLKETRYKGKNKDNFGTWSFAADAEFYHALYAISDVEYRKSLYEEGESSNPFPTIEESFSKMPMLPSVYLLIMQAIDIISIDAYLSFINSTLTTTEVSKDYTKIDELSKRNIGIGAAKYSSNSYFYNDDYFVRLIGEGVYLNKSCWIFDYYSEPSDVYMVEEITKKSKTNKSLYSGRIYIDKENGDLICGEMNENVVPVDGTNNFVKRKILLEIMGVVK